MTLQTNAIITVDELVSSMGLSRNDVQIDTFAIYNTSSDATSATVAKSGNTLTLVITGGANAGTTNIDLSNASYDTIGELLTYIEGLSKGWVVNRYCSSDFPSTAMFNFGATEVLAISNEYVLTAFNQLFLEELINSSSDFAESFCRRKFTSQAHVEYRDGNGRLDLFVREFPITVFTSLILFDFYTQTDIYTYDEHTDYEVYLDQAKIYMPGGFAQGHKNFKVSYTAGYTSATMPEDLKHAVKEICKLLYFKRDKQGVASERIGRYAISYAKNGTGNYVLGVPIPPETIAMLIPYKRRDRLHYQ